jgi:hypothetical protein
MYFGYVECRLSLSNQGVNVTGGYSGVTYTLVVEGAETKATTNIAIYVTGFTGLSSKIRESGGGQRVFWRGLSP